MFHRSSATPGWLSLALLALVTLAGCDTPTDPVAPDTVDDALLAQLAREVDQSTDIRLPNLGTLLEAAREAVQATDGNAEAVRHFRRARRLGNAAEDAREAGDTEAARRLARQSQAHLLAGVIAALGTEVVGEAVAGSAAGLERIHTRIEGRDVPERIARAVERLDQRVATAQEAMANEQWVPALYHALVAAEGIRNLNPRYVARKWMRQAARLLRQARQAAGDDATEDEAKALGRALHLLTVARGEFEAGHPFLAARAARRAAILSWGVIQGRAGTSG